MMEKSPIVSVVIPTYNRVSRLKRAIDSVCNQSFKHIEIILIDDGSTDETEIMVRENFPNISYIKTENRGVSAARNLGIKKSRGEYVAFLDSDDEWFPKKIEAQVVRIRSCGRRWIHTEERWVRNGIRVNQKKIHRKSGGDIFNRSLSLCLISPSTVMLERSLLEEFGGFDESFVVCEDFDLWLRILSQYEIEFISNELIQKYGGHDDQLSAKYKAMDEYRIITYEKLITSKYLNNERRQSLAEIADKKCEILINGYTKHGRLEKAIVIESKRKWFKRQLSFL
jgi:glycosyltransferase involved in cell wall biosynthesis